MFELLNLFRELTVKIIIVLLVVGAVAAQAEVSPECGPGKYDLILKTMTLQIEIQGAEKVGNTEDASRLLSVFARNVATILKSGPCAENLTRWVDKALLQRTAVRDILTEELDPLGNTFRNFERQNSNSQ